MKTQFKFTFADIESQYRSALDMGYKFISCLEYAERNGKVDGLTVVNRVDIDVSVKKADRIRDIFDRLGIKATFFVRLHAPEYNPFSFENYIILKRICNRRHEIGYHSEIVDQAAIWSEDAAGCLVRDLDVLNRMLNISVKGIASHGGMTGLNNLDFWKKNRPKDFGVRYETYEESNEFNLFKSSFYISDSEWFQWKCYNKGQLCLNDRRTFKEHLVDLHPIIYLLIHPETYYDEFPYS
jgi:hypothetical protein